MDDESSDWACEAFQRSPYSDARHGARVQRMAALAALNPAGHILEVFQTSADRQGAYDLLENRAVSSEQVIQSIGSATAGAVSDYDRAFVVVDGTSVSITDRTKKKGLGAVGSANMGVQGLKVVNAYALAPDGTPLGLLDQQWWARPRHKRRQDHQRRPVQCRETQHWLKCLQAVSERLSVSSQGTRAWFVVDREGDGLDMLLAAQATGHLFTIRSNADRCISLSKGCRKLSERIEQCPFGEEFELPVPGGAGRAARVARLRVRACKVTLRMRPKPSGPLRHLSVNVVDVLECGTTPKGERPLHWRLLTNAPIHIASLRAEAIRSYTLRWSIEVLHRTWKSGACCIEETQLRSREAVIKWGAIMIAVASRIERIKRRGREEPELPASVEFTQFEIRAITMLKRKHKKSTETIPDSMPTLAQAVYWMAELGGYTGKSSGGPPGSITIQRGYDYIRPFADGL
jgi:Transposase Tn5 dimerisation domain/Transposase DNA-binding